MKNSEYDTKFLIEVLKSGLAGYNIILEADMTGTRPLYISKAWRNSAQGQGMEDRKKEEV